MKAALLCREIWKAYRSIVIFSKAMYSDNTSPWNQGTRRSCRFGIVKLEIADAIVSILIAADPVRFC